MPQMTMEGTSLVLLTTVLSDAVKLTLSPPSLPAEEINILLSAEYIWQFYAICFITFLYTE